MIIGLTEKRLMGPTVRVMTNNFTNKYSIKYLREQVGKIVVFLSSVETKSQLLNTSDSDLSLVFRLTLIKFLKVVNGIGKING